MYITAKLEKPNILQDPNRVGHRSCSFKLKSQGVREEMGMKKDRKERGLRDQNLLNKNTKSPSNGG